MEAITRGASGLTRVADLQKRDERDLARRYGSIGVRLARLARGEDDRVVTPERQLASRWTFYIGKDGKILAIDKAVKPATSAEDMAAKIGDLKVAAKK